MMKNNYQFLLFFLLLPFLTQAQTGCPGCTVSLPALPLDTIFMEAAPDGMLFSPYDEDISFRLPITTDPVHDQDPDTPAGIDIISIDITSVDNLPFGLSWEANQTEFNTQGGDTDGCVKLCGTPEEYGTFEVDVVLSAQILVISQTTSFSFFITILPNTSTTDGFTVNNTEGCSEVVAEFTNNNPSNGVEGFTYLWDFGNGFSSSLESPQPVVYDQPGEYMVSYLALVDTSAYFLNEVVVLGSDCSDFLGRPDLYVEVKNETGAIVFTSEIQSNVDYPVTFHTHVNIENDGYSLSIIDDDSGINGGDDLCGTILFDQADNGFFDDGSLSLTIEIDHRIDTVTSEELIKVFELPDGIHITGDVTTLDCDNASTVLSTTSTDMLQWQLDGASILDANDSDVEVFLPGVYTCLYTSLDGCSVISPAYTLAPSPHGVVVEFAQIENYLVLADPSQLNSGNYNLQWYLNGQAIDGAIDIGYCIQISGTYSLEVTDSDTHCSVNNEIFSLYNPADGNCITETDDEKILTFSVFPNPVRDQLHIQLENKNSAITFKLYNQLGQLVLGGNEITEGVIDVNHLNTGIYFLELLSGDQAGRMKLIKQ